MKIVPIIKNIQKNELLTRYNNASHYGKEIASRTNEIYKNGRFKSNIVKYNSIRRSLYRNIQPQEYPLLGAFLGLLTPIPGGIYIGTLIGYIAKKGAK